MSRAYSTKLPLDEVIPGHESPEVDLPRTFLSTAAVIAMIILSCIASHWAFFELVKPFGERSPTPMYGDGLVLPPAPRLEGIEMMGGSPLNSDKVIATHQLQTYGWVDRDKGLIRVPIERAMQIAIESNWLPSSPAPRNGASDANQSRRSTPGSNLNTP